MALPKEPRQKMINIMYLVLTALLALNVSSEILNAFKVVNESLRVSNQNLTNSNATIYQAFQEDMKDPGKKDKATYWNDRAMKAAAYSKSLYDYIETLKDTLIDQSGLKKDDAGKPILDSNNRLVYNESDLEASTRLFGNGPGGHGWGPTLQQKLVDYKGDVLGIDNSINQQFAATFPVDATPPRGEDGKQKDFTEGFFHMTPTVAALTILSKFQNNVKNAENSIATYCHNQVGAVQIVYNKFQGIATVNSQYVMPGEKLTVTAGVGAFNDQASPTITIGGQVVPLNSDGVATKDIVASGSGDQSISYNIRFRQPDGTFKDLPGEIKYTVGTPSGAAIMLDKMNVFYIGVPNPIHISSSTGWDRTTVSASGCSLSGTGSERVVTVTGGTTASITVTAEGKSSKFDFRVKRIPDPVFKVGPSAGGRIQAAVFKSQQYCRAELENFDFAASFQVISGTVYFTGANFPVTQIATLNGNNLGSLAQLSKCGPGTSVIFDNLKVKGPDGQERTIQAPGYLLQ